MNQEASVLHKYRNRGKPVKKVDEELTELEGPYECPYCQGHMMLDTTFLDQVEEEVTCPYCKAILQVPEEDLSKLLGEND